MNKRSPDLAKRKRDGVAVVELALMLPILFLLTLGILEVCEGTFLKQKVLIASHEGARIAIRRSGTLPDVHSAVADYLNSRNLQFGSIDAVVKCSPSPESAKMLEPVTVTVEIDVDSNSRMPLSLYRYINGKSIVTEVTMFKEFDGIEIQ